MQVMAPLVQALSPQAYLYLLLFPLLLILLLHYFMATRRRSASKQLNHGKLPPSPPGLPVIGHMHLVGSDPHVSLANLAKKHGPDGLMLLQLGQVRNLVVSSPRAAEAILRTHDHVFATRPPSTVADILLSGSSDVALAPYGEYWRQVRKLVTTHLLSAKKVHSLRRAREEEVSLVIARIQEAAATGAVVDMTELLNSFTNDIVCRAVSGKFFREEGRNKLFRKLIDGNVAQFGGFNLEDYFPSLAKIDLLARVMCAKSKKLKNRWDDLLDKIIDDHASKSSLGHHDEHDQQQDHERDFVDVLLSLQQEYNLSRENVKAILMDMFAAGTDTSYIVLEFTMAELIRKPHLMTKLRAEVRKHTPKAQQMVKEDDMNNMTYLKAVIKETLRLHPPAPLLLPRLSMAKCDVNGYTIPAETRVIVNAWALGRDTMSWEKADEFMPERFMDSVNTAIVDFKGTNFQFVPFGAGRRICPGLNFGMASVEIMLANLVYCFDWELPNGLEKEDIDMTDVFGVTMRRKEKLFLVPRSQDVNHA